MQIVADGGEVIDRLFGALEAGDLQAAGDCLRDDARVWHCFDRVSHDRDHILSDWKQFIADFPERFVQDVRRQATPTGFVQQHVMVARTAAGRQMAWPVCVVVTTLGGKITHLDEYIDRAGYFVPA